MSAVLAELCVHSSRPEICAAPNDRAQPCTVSVNSMVKRLPASVIRREQRGRERASSSPAVAPLSFFLQDTNPPTTSLSLSPSSGCLKGQDVGGADSKLVCETKVALI